MTRLGVSRIGRIGLATLFVLLAGFHLALLGARVVDGSVLDPAIAVEWVIGLALLLGLTRLHRAGLSPIRGRGAVVLWLLVVFLHAIAFIPGDDGALELRVTQNSLAIIPVGVAIGVVASVLAGLSLVTSGRLRLHLYLSGIRPGHEGVPLSTDLLSALVPRAPPV